MRDLFLLAIQRVVTIAKLLRPGAVRAAAAESILVKQQLIVGNRSRQRAPNLTTLDRFAFGLITLFVNPRRIPKLSKIVRPATLLRFHKSLVDRKYHMLFSSSGDPSKPGPKGPSAELIAAIVELKRRNPRFGCVKIAQQITHTFGLDINKDVVRRVLARHYKPDGSDGPSWLTLVAQAKDSLWSVDLFRCETILLCSIWVMVVMDVYSRRIIGFGVERSSIDGTSVCRMFNQSIAGNQQPKRIRTDHDPLFRFHRWLANLRVQEIDQIRSIPHTPTSHPFVERLIGTLRREYLDRLFFWNALDLERKLQAYKIYYNNSRVHQSLNGDTPEERSGKLRAAYATLDSYRWRQHCHGLFHTPNRCLITNSPSTR